MKKYIIFGTGVIGTKAYKLLNHDLIYGFCDNNTHSAGDSYYGKPVFDAGFLEEIYNDDDYDVILATTKPKNIVQISRQLDRMSIPFVLLEDVAADMVHDEARIYEGMNPPKTFCFSKDTEYIIPLERVDDAGVIGSYLWQDLWAARHIINNKPDLHYDIGSRLDGFITHLLSAGINVTMLDIRPLPVHIQGLRFLQTDATKLQNIPDDSLDSISALCSLEHFGLGRYGDPIDPMACFKCFEAIQRKLRKDGYLYLSVPIGKEHLEFNAHRVFSPSTIVDSFNEMILLEFSSCMNEEYEENIALDKYDGWDLYGGDRFWLFRFKKV